MKAIVRCGCSLLGLVLAFCQAGDAARAQPASAPPPAEMLALLERRVAEDPGRADCWRLIGRIHRQRGAMAEAEAAFRRALEVQPENAAAHCDYGELLFHQGDRPSAVWHFEQVFRLAPQSSYAQHLAQQGFQPPPRPPFNAEPARSAEQLTRLPPVTPIPALAAPADAESAATALPAAYEIQSFDGGTQFERGLNQLEAAASGPQPLRAFVEFGALHNSNITLTPTSRELTGAGPASFQGFLSPDLEWVARRGEQWRLGPLARGYFTVNEGGYSDLNLASFQPGAFLERDAAWGDAALIGRMEYVYTLDLLGSNRFGERHALTASLMMLPADSDVLYGYVTVSQSDFADDGVDPAVTSLDGPAITVGLMRLVQTSAPVVAGWSYGVDFQAADTEGADYRFVGIAFHGEVTLRLAERWTFLPSGNLGYRSYGDFTGPVSRNEFTSRIAGRLRYQVSDAWSLSLVAAYDRFASPNDDFDGDRTEAGFVVTLVY